MNPGSADDATRPLPVRSPETTGDGSSRELVAAQERGTTILADRVVDKIAARAALDIAHAAALSRRLAGREFGSPRVRARAQIDGRIASLELDMAVDYPASVRAVTRGVRGHVTERVSTLCDLTVDHIDINVVVLRRPDIERKRVQ